jgi:hypothetical protein
MDTTLLYFTQDLSSLVTDYGKLEHSLTAANVILN